MSTRLSIRCAAFLPLVATGILVTACGSSSPSSGGGGGSQPASGGSGSSNSVLDGIGHPVNICNVLPVATVASVSGEAITVAKEDDTPSVKIYSCDYTSADGTSGVTVSVLAMDAAVGYDGSVAANKSVSAAGYKPIPGLGDKAFTSIAGVEALFGNVSITVSDLQSDAASETLIRDLQPKL
jgi:hypothetical protein